jgi:hypothetical protein
MTDLPAEIRRPLDDAERDLLNRLAIVVVAAQTGADVETVVEALDTFTETGDAFYRGDYRDVWLVVGGNPLVHATREWLSFYAHFAPESN